jgi:murein DD-endopeptidase MepM/ murein hydrolase activator NlpD
MLAAVARCRLLLPFGLLLGVLLPARPAVPADWVSPLRGAHPVVHPFQAPITAWGPGHRGVDLLAATGDPVLAAGAGVVLFAGRVAGVPVVSVRHPGGLSTTYQPVRPTVHAGDPVRTGQVVGRLVRAGGHCLPRACLHWGLRRGTVYLDPLSLLGFGRVRLLPLWPAGSASPGWPLRTAASAAAGSAAGGVVLRRRRRRR